MTRASPTSLYLFRRDLRVADNPALNAAQQNGPVLAVYIHDDVAPGPFKLGAASKCWLHQSLERLNASLEGCLNLYQGEMPKVIDEVLARFPTIAHVHWNRCYEPWRIAQDKALKADLTKRGLDVTSHNASLLWEPWQIMTKAGTPYQVFTPYYTKGCLGAPAPRLPESAPLTVSFVQDEEGLTLESLTLVPRLRWATRVMENWRVGEEAAKARLEAFCDEAINDYALGRDYPAKRVTSLLSPHLAFGEISPHQIWWYVRARLIDHGPNVQGFDTFLKELAWREFSYYLLYHFPQLPTHNFNKKFDAFGWGEDQAFFEAWQQGKTGYPLVDAGMRELWQTGTMHNRVRMVVASFLVKNLRIHWRCGARWFWDCLVDADLASNSASWQWVAGCGADAAPYFRIFNPTTQGEKFDPDGAYTRRFVPELGALPQKYLFKPWEAPEAVLRGAGITLGHTYPRPIVDLKASREAALNAYAFLSGGTI